MAVLRVGDIIDAESTFPDNYINQHYGYSMDADGSRRVVTNFSLRPDEWPGIYRDTIVSRYAAPIMGRVIIRSPIVFVGDYVKYIITDEQKALTNTESLSSIEPVNQIPWLYGWRAHNNLTNPEQGGFLKHACTFAHKVSVNHNPDSFMMGEGLHYDMLPDTPHTDESNNRNRVALRYARALCGYSYDAFMDYGNLNPLVGAGIVEDHRSRNWASRLARMKELDSYICEVCAGNEFWVRDFIHNLLSPGVWDTAFNGIHTRINFGTIRYKRFPKIDKTNPLSWLPSLESVAEYGGNEAAFTNRSWWLAQMRYFRAAVTRWDNDERVRQPDTIIHLIPEQ